LVMIICAVNIIDLLILPDGLSIPRWLLLRSLIRSLPACIPLKPDRVELLNLFRRDWRFLPVHDEFVHIAHPGHPIR